MYVEPQKNQEVKTSYETEMVGLSRASNATGPIRDHEYTSKRRGTYESFKNAICSANFAPDFCFYFQDSIRENHIRNGS